MKKRIQIFNYKQKYSSKNPFERNNIRLNPLYNSKSKKVLFSSVKLGKKNFFENSISLYLKRNNISNEKEIKKKYSNYHNRVNINENSKKINNNNILSKTISISDIFKERFSKKYNSNNNKFKNKLFCYKEKNYHWNKNNNNENNENLNLNENKELRISDFKKYFKNKNTLHTNSKNTCLYLRKNNFLETNKCSLIKLTKKTIKLIRFPKNYFSSFTKNNLLSNDNLSRKKKNNNKLEKKSSFNEVIKDCSKNKKHNIKEINNFNESNIKNKISKKRNICKVEFENNIKTQKIIKINDNPNFVKELALQENNLPFVRTNKNISKNIKKFEINKYNNNISSKETYYISFLNSEKNIIDSKSPTLAINQNNKNKNPIKKAKAKKNIYLDLSIDSIERNTQSKFLNYELGESDRKSTINYSLDNNSKAQKNINNEHKKIEYEAPIEEIEKIAYEFINNSKFIDKKISFINNRLYNLKKGN